MIYIKADIPKELSSNEDQLKAIYHSKNIVCFFIFKNRERETVYQKYQS